MGFVDCNILELKILCNFDPWYATHVKINFKTGCWVYTGKLNRNGYARKNWRHRVLHRVVYDIVANLTNRMSVPTDKLLDHLCRTRACFNPKHLDPVSAKINTSRGQAILFKKQEVESCPKSQC